MVFFFNDTATTEIYTLSLHDALPIFGRIECQWVSITVERTVKRHPRIDTVIQRPFDDIGELRVSGRDRKSTRLNSSHGYISYAVFCLKKKKFSCMFSRLPNPVQSFHS